MIEIIQEWDERAQQCFFWACLVLAAITVWTVVRNVRIALRGYPPLLASGQKAAGIEATECIHEDNLTGYCIKSGTNCETHSQCQAEIRNRAGL